MCYQSASKQSVKTLYIGYFGLREPLVQTQVLPYLRELAQGGLEVHLLTFEPELRARWPEQERRAQERRLVAEGIHWSALPYHKRPTLPATLFDVIAGIIKARRLIRHHGISVVHARSHVPGYMGLWLKRLTRCCLIFDLRGLMAEEYEDAGIWTPDSLPFKLIKRVERAVLRRADQVVTLTNRAAAWVEEQGFARPHVIPCCVDFARFALPAEVSETRRHLRARFTVVYTGSVTGLYLLREMVRFVRALEQLRPDTHFLVLTAGDEAYVLRVAEEEGLAADALTVMRAQPEEVGSYVAAARVGLSFRKPTFSQLAASPTKVPEYWAAGIPVITNAGIGDMDEIVRRERVGIVLDKFTEEDFTAAARALLALLSEQEALAERCRAVAQREFSLTAVGGPRYRRVYQALANGSRPL